MKPRALLPALLVVTLWALSTAPMTSAGENTDIATFAGGCFWCVESDFDQVPGVLETISGYTGGSTESPTYEDVTYGNTGHFEAVQIHFDPSKVTFAELVEIFWRSVDPTDDGGQFCDRGTSYRTAIFTHSDEQLETAKTSKTTLENAATLKHPIVTSIIKAGPFYPAEEYHQNYYRKNPLRYRFYRYSCGRDGHIQEIWGDQAHKGIGKKQ